MRIGLILPHFGKSADPQRISDGAILAERLGFDSLWVRDHIFFNPHDLEGDDPTFTEPFMVLSWVAARTAKIGLGSAVLIPTRHAMHLAQSVSTLSWLSNRHFDLGFGMGGIPVEMKMAGLADIDRLQLAMTQLKLAQELWTGKRVTHHSSFYDLDGAYLAPTPRSLPTMWWGGKTPASVRLVAEHRYGWLASRIDFATFEARISEIRRLTGQRDAVLLGTIPLVSIADTRAEAMAHVPMDMLLHSLETDKFAARPKGAKAKPEELAGAFLAGTSADVIEGMRRYQQLGCDLLILDLRLRFDDWSEQIERLGKEVLPSFAD